MGEARKYEHPAGCRRWCITVVCHYWKCRFTIHEATACLDSHGYNIAWFVTSQPRSE